MLKLVYDIPMTFTVKAVFAEIDDLCFLPLSRGVGQDGLMPQLLRGQPCPSGALLRA